MDALTRTYIGIRPPQEVQQELAAAQLALKRKAGSEAARWAPPHELFLTLCNLGELTLENLYRIHPTIAPVLNYQRPLDLRLEAFGGSPNMTQPRIAWIGVGGDTDELTRLHAELERALTPLHLTREVTSLACYVPLGRLRQESESARSDLGRAVRMTQLPSQAVWHVDQVDIMKSEVGPYGPTMVTMGYFRLG